MKILNKYKQIKKFKEKLKIVRYMEIVSLMDISLSVYHPESYTKLRVFKFMNENQRWIDAFQSISIFDGQIYKMNGCYDRDGFDSIFDCFKFLCGVDINENTRFNEIINAKPTLNYRIMKHAILLSDFTNSSRNFNDNYAKDYKRYIK